MEPEEFVSRGRAAQAAANRVLAEALVGRRVQFAHQAGLLDPSYQCTRVTDEGLVEIEGLVGYFGPHLFVVAGDEACR